MNRTPFYAIHQKLGAKLVPFAGYEMPVQYTGIGEEHRRVRNSVGIFDVSHMGEFFVNGKGALSFLQKITINDVSKLVPGKVQYSAMCYESGGIIDDLLIYMLEEHSYMVVVNAANRNKDLEWMKQNCTNDVKLIDNSDSTALLAVQGPKSLATLQKLTNVNLSVVKYYTFITGIISGVEMIISRTGYTGELGFEIYFSIEHAEKIWDAIVDAGKEYEIAPIGLGARDTLRMEMGYCLYGNDIDQTTNPLEAGLGWITKLLKDDFTAKAVLEKVKTEGLKRKLVGLTIEEKAIPRHGYEVVVNGKNVGVVTSGTFSPSLEKGIALAYITIPYAELGATVFIDVRGKLFKATVVDIPFYKKN